MLTIKQAIEKVIEIEGSKYKAAQSLDIQFTMLKNYLKGNTRRPQFKTCKVIYDKYSLVVFPFTEEELQKDEM